jgi:hypothetical protein
METRTVTSTSKRSATTDDVVLRETKTTRLIFRPILVDNIKEKEASVKGTFVFQKKGISDTWEDSESTSLSSLKKGESVKLELKSAELLKLYTEVQNLYEMYRESGIPRGEAQFVKANRAVEAVAHLSDEEITAVVKGQEFLGAQAVARLIQWASDAQNFTLMFERLESLKPESLVNLNAAVGISTLKRALMTWSKHRNDSDEEFWQDLLTEHEFVLEQIFHVPIFVIKSKAYMGGKNALNKGGGVVDFLIKNNITNSVGLVEIKTPKTDLLTTECRNGIYNVSPELSGAVMQVLNYRESLAKERNALLSGDEIDAEAFDPKCVVIIGHAKNELKDRNKLKSFELFRRQLSDVEVITYDELFNKTRKLVQTLEGVANDEE